ncbi:MAG: hypothetical protein L3K02_02935 [Thermoplasmata archaeon]|nr:hypothetical protein [Thermoplasmata archaeon]
MKKKLGETLGSKDPTAQVNELLCKVLAHNITVLIHESFERGIPLPGNPGRDGEQVEAELALSSPTKVGPTSAPISQVWEGEDN